MEDKKSSENSSSEEVSSELYDLSGIDEKQAEALHESGFETRAGVASASQSELTSVEGIGKSLAARIQADAVGRQETQRESDESEDTDTNQESNPDVYVNPFPKKTHLLSATIALSGSVVLFLLMAVLLADFRLLPTSGSNYADQFNPVVLGCLIVSSTVSTAISSTICYHKISPTWLREHLSEPYSTTISGILMGLLLFSLPVGSTLLGAPGLPIVLSLLVVIYLRNLSLVVLWLVVFIGLALVQYVVESLLGFSFSTWILVSELILTAILIILASYGIGMLTLGDYRKELRDLVATAETVDDSLASLNISLLENYEFSVPYRSATVAELAGEEVNPDNPTVLAFSHDSDPTGFADYYDTLVEFSDTLENLEHLQSNPDDLTENICSVVEMVEPTRIENPEARRSAHEVVTTGTEIVVRYDSLLEREGFDNQEREKLLEHLESTRAIVTENQPLTQNHINTVVEQLRNLDARLKEVERLISLRERIETVREEWSERTNINLDATLNLPDESEKDLTTHEERISRAENNIDIAAKLTRFRSTSNQSATEEFLDSVERWLRKDLSTEEGSSIDSKTIETAFTASEAALTVADLYPELSVENVIKQLADRINADNLNRDDVRQINNSVELAEETLERTGILHTEYNSEAVNPETVNPEAVNQFVGAVKNGVQRHFDDSNSRTSIDTIDDAITTVRLALSLAETYPSFPFISIVESLSEHLVDDTLSDEQIDQFEMTLEQSQRVLEFLQIVDTTNPAVPDEDFRDAVRTGLREGASDVLEDSKERIERMSDALWDADDLMTYNPEEFEHLVASLYESEGYDTTVTQQSQDLGIDVWARKADVTVGIQVKQNKEGNTVGRPTLQKTGDAIRKGKADRIQVVTSSSFARTAEEYARDDSDIGLVDRTQLLRRLSESEVPPPVQKVE